MNTQIHISIITVFPELHETWAHTSLLKKAQEAGHLSIDTIRLADMVAPKERIDAPTCGPGPGMVLRAEVVSAAIDQAQKKHGKGTVVFFSPSGELLTHRSAQAFVEKMVSGGDSVQNDCSEVSIGSEAQQNGAQPNVNDEEPNGVILGRQSALARGEIRNPDSEPRQGQSFAARTDTHHLVLVCARYEGVDCRVEREYADAIVSIGNFVLMGGDVPAQIFTETVLRFLPGILGNVHSLTDDSFQGPLVDYPAYGQPKEWRGQQIPEILLSGDHGKINQWREGTALKQTLTQHFAWLRSSDMDKQLRDKVATTIPPHYAILMHDRVLVGKKDDIKPGTTSVTTIDLHDIARSCATYNVQKFFIVTPLHDQQRLLRVFFQFWHTAQGKNYNINRYDAMRRVCVVGSIEDAEAMIREECGDKKPLRIATSAKSFDGVPALDYHEQGEVWQHDHPVSLIFGTGQGLTNDFLQSCDYLLVPVRGFTDYNHLSVRSAVAIILDRWLAWKQPIQK